MIMNYFHLITDFLYFSEKWLKKNTADLKICRIYCIADLII